MRVRKELDAMIAKMFYTGGLFFNLIRNPYYVKVFTYAARNPIPSYKPPGYNSLSTLSQCEKVHVERLLELIRSTWKQKIYIYNDGWAKAQKIPLINFIAVTVNGPIFLNCVNTEGEQKSMYFIADKHEDCIKEIEAQNVI